MQDVPGKLAWSSRGNVTVQALLGSKQGSVRGSWQQLCAHELILQSCDLECFCECKLLPAIGQPSGAQTKELVLMCRAGQIVGAMTQILQPSSLSAGPLYFGVYNMNFYVHSPFQYKLVVRPPLLQPICLATVFSRRRAEIIALCYHHPSARNEPPVPKPHTHCFFTEPRKGQNGSTLGTHWKPHCPACAPPIQAVLTRFHTLPEPS
jgi:hypothetical protein